MKEIHKIREEFYRKTRGKDRQYILKLIKEGSKGVLQELDAIKSDPKLIQKGGYVIPRPESTENIRQVREREGKYEKRYIKKKHQ
jgi:chaperonin cofactor prefoldin